jgi:hypothetical protein
MTKREAKLIHALGVALAEWHGEPAGANCWQAYSILRDAGLVRDAPPEEVREALREIEPTHG